MGWERVRKEVRGGRKQSPSLPSSPPSQALGIPRVGGQLHKRSIPGRFRVLGRDSELLWVGWGRRGERTTATCSSHIQLPSMCMFTAPLLTQPGPWCQVPVLFLGLSLHKSTCPLASSSSSSSHTSSSYCRHPRGTLLGNGPQDSHGNLKPERLW